MTHRLKSALCLFFALFFIVAGVMHFVAVDSFVAIVPPLFPFPKLIVWVTGIMEIAGRAAIPSDCADLLGDAQISWVPISWVTDSPL